MFKVPHNFTISDVIPVIFLLYVDLPSTVFFFQRDGMVIGSDVKLFRCIIRYSYLDAFWTSLYDVNIA